MMRRWYASFLAIMLITALSVIGLRVTVGNSFFTARSNAVRSLPVSDTLGVFQAGTFFLKNTLGPGSPDEVVKLGTSRMLPVTGDWDGDNVDTVGVYDPATGHFTLQNINKTGAPIAYNFFFGPKGGIPVSGDWTGSGHDSVGVYVSGVFYLRNTLNSGKTDERIGFGKRGDIPVIGDWTGQGHDGIGVYRPSTGTFYLTETICSTCNPPATYSTPFGPTKGLPFAGHWSTAKASGLGIWAFPPGKIYLKNDAIHKSSADVVYTYGTRGDMPIVGHWSSSS